MSEPVPAQRRPGSKRFAPKPDPVQTPAHSSRIANLPNALTLFRLILVVPFVILLFGMGHSASSRVVATIIFVVASATDFLDGSIARSRNLVTNFGKIADPIADKALTGAALVGLCFLGELPWIVAIVILAREAIVTLMRFWVIRDGVIAASRGGKAKTVFQLLAILLYLLPITGWVAGARAWIMGIALVLTVITGLDYGVRAVRLHRTGERTSAAR